jgi:hypothetical protein
MTEFLQPINPIRITVLDSSETFTVLVFAIAISNQHDIEYLTVYGNYYSKDRRLLVEVCINGQWIT